MLQGDAIANGLYNTPWVAKFYATVHKFGKPIPTTNCFGGSFGHLE